MKEYRHKDDPTIRYMVEDPGDGNAHVRDTQGNEVGTFPWDDWLEYHEEVKDDE